MEKTKKNCNQTVTLGKDHEINEDKSDSLAAGENTFEQQKLMSKTQFTNQKLKSETSQD